MGGEITLRQIVTADPGVTNSSDDEVQQQLREHPIRVINADSPGLCGTPMQIFRRTAALFLIVRKGS